MKGCFPCPCNLAIIPNRNWLCKYMNAAGLIPMLFFSKLEAGILLMEGEQCNKWVPGKASPVETFHCPTQDNQWEKMFCCGTCTASYCCSSTKERLDQTSCPKVVRTEDQEPEEPAGPTVKKLSKMTSISHFGGPFVY